MPSTLNSDDKAKIKRAIPKANNKIITVSVARLYIAFPSPQKWTYTGRSGALVLARDTVGDTYFLKIVDVIGAGQILWDQELWKGFQYNQDRTFFHSFEVEGYLMGLSFADESEAQGFYKKVSALKLGQAPLGREGPVNLPTSRGEQQGQVPRKPSPIDTSTSAGRASPFSQPAYEQNYQSSPVPQSAEGSKTWKELLQDLEALGITPDVIENNRDFVRQYVLDAYGPQAVAEMDAETARPQQPVKKSTPHLPPPPPIASGPPPPGPPLRAPAPPAPGLGLPSSPAQGRRGGPPPPPPPSRKTSTTINSPSPRPPSPPSQPARRPVPPPFQSSSSPALPPKIPLDGDDRQSAPPRVPVRNLHPPPPPEHNNTKFNVPPPFDASKLSIPASNVPPPLPGRSRGLSNPPPVPVRNAGVNAPPPPPPRVENTEPAIPARNTEPYIPPPPPPPPGINRPAPPRLPGRSAPASAPPPATGCPPPPPPPPPMSNGPPPPPMSNGPPPPPPPPMSNGPPPPPPPASVGPPPPPPPPPSGAPSIPVPSAGDPVRGALLASIRGAGGIGALKKVDTPQNRDSVASAPSRGSVSTPTEQKGDPASILAAALAQRKNKVAQSDDEDEGDDWD